MASPSGMLTRLQAARQQRQPQPAHQLTRKSPIAALPAELLCRVAEQPNLSADDVKAMRLVKREWAGQLGPPLFWKGGVSVSFLKKDWEKLQEIAAHPEVPKWIRQINFYELDPREFDMYRWSEEKRHARDDPQYNQILDLLEKAVTDPNIFFPDRPKTPWIQPDGPLSVTLHEIVKVLEGFENLRAVSSKPMPNGKIINCEGYPLEAGTLRAWQCRRVGWVRTANPGYSMLIQLILRSEKLRKRVKHIQWVDETTGCLTGMTNTVALSKTLYALGNETPLHGIKSLDLDCTARHLHKRSEIGKLLRGCKNVESLRLSVGNGRTTLIANGRFRFGPVIPFQQSLFQSRGLLSEATLPRLREIHLVGIHLLQRGFAELISKHASTLRHVHLESCHYLPDAIARLRIPVNTHLHLKSFRVEDPGLDGFRDPPLTEEMLARWINGENVVLPDVTNQSGPDKKSFRFITGSHQRRVDPVEYLAYRSSRKRASVPESYERPATRQRR